MIELVIAERCTGCNACVEVCPTDVFEAVSGGAPLIARQDDCQTCFMCELYCREDAIYVAPDCENPTPVDKDAILASGLLGEFRRNHGWDEWADIPAIPTSTGGWRASSCAQGIWRSPKRRRNGWKEASCQAVKTATRLRHPSVAGTRSLSRGPHFHDTETAVAIRRVHAPRQSPYRGLALPRRLPGDC